MAQLPDLETWVKEAGERDAQYALKYLEEEYGVSIRRLIELAQADREGLVHIIQGPDPGASVCGNCGNFIRNPGKRTGVCKVQSCYRDHRGKDEPWRGSFSPSQSRKACRKFVRAKAALRREQDGQQTG